MSLFRVNVVDRNPKDERRETPPLEVLADAGSELTSLPADVLRQAAGVRTTKGSGFLVDNVGHRFAAQASLVA